MKPAVFLVALATTKIPRPDLPSGRPDVASEQQCIQFPEFVVVQVDSGEKGATSIVVRSARTDEERKAACAETKARDGEVKIPDNEQYFSAATDEMIVTQSADGFGDLFTNWVYDAKSGKTLHTADYGSREVLYTRQGKALSLSYERMLKVACSLRGGDKGCWEKVRKANALPAKVAAPKCDWKKVEAGGDDARAVQVFAPFVVKDVRTDAGHFTGGKARCVVAP